MSSLVNNLLNNNHYSITWGLREKINSRFEKIENETAFQIAEGAFWLSKPLFFLGSLAEMVSRAALCVLGKIAARFEEDPVKKQRIVDIAANQGFSGAKNSFGAGCVYLFDTHTYKGS